MISIFTGNYTLRSSNSACCISQGNFHQNCNGDDISQSKCAEACDQDAICKGYTMNTAIKDCNIYTASACPTSFRGPYSSGKVGSLNLSVKCGSTSYSGCYVKNSGKP